MKNTWIAIVNPNACMQKAGHDWKIVERLLKKNEIEFKVEFTKAKRHAIELTHDAIQQGFRKFAIVGGDGTLNEVVHGIFSQNEIPTSEFLVGVIPIGTGNDWCRMYGIPYNYAKAVRILKQEKSFVQDVGVVDYMNGNGKHTRYFVNVSGMGYDAVVAQKTNYQKDIGKANKFSYFLNIFSTLFSYNNGIAEIRLDDKVFVSDVFSMNVGICKYNGGGMKQLPFARPDDGLLDFTLIRPIKKLDLFRHIRKLYTGKFANVRQIKTEQARRIEITSQGSRIWIEVDGESLGHSPFRFTLIEKGLRVVINRVNV